MANPIPADSGAPISTLEPPVEKQDPVSTKELLKFMQDEFARMDNDRKKRATNWSKYHAQFRGILDNVTSNSTKSRLFVNRTKVAVMSGLANVLDVILPNADFFDVAGRTEFDEKGAGLAKKVMDWLVKIGNFTDESVRYVLQAAIYGTTFGKITKRTITQVSIDKTPTVNGGWMNHEIKRKISFYALETIDIYDIWVDPDAVGHIDSASGVFHRTRRNTNYLKEKEKQNIFGNITDIGISATQNDDIDDKRKSNLGLPSTPNKKDQVDLYEYEGRVPADVAKKAGIKVMDDEFEVECIVHIANMRTIVRVVRNTSPGQERFFISDVWELSGNKSMYGRGIPENVSGPQVALNVTTNLRLDNKAWAIAHPIAYDMQKIEDPKDLVARVNWLIRCKGDPSHVLKEIAIPDMTSSSMQEAKDFERIIDDESGQTEIVQSGQGFGANRTAQGVTLAFSAASRPVRLIARGFEQNLIARGLKKIFMFFITDLDQWITLRVTDNADAIKYLSVDPISLALDLDFVPSGSYLLAMRENSSQRMTEFIQGVAQTPVVKGTPQGQLNWKYVTQKFYEGLGLRDFEKVWMDPMPNPATSGAPGATPMRGVPNETVAGAGTGTNKTPTEDPRAFIKRIMGNLGEGTNSNEGSGQ